MLRDNPEDAQMYLEIALEEINEEGGVGAFMIALRHVIEARGGIGDVAAKTGLSRQQLYKTLSEEGNPTLTTLMKITRAVGVKLVDRTGKR
ncbi:putative addiction module antidote protein [Enterobacteriaceae bacterium 89]|nr:putative addiction module antidote protein [Enterobacteriaceae bacterium 89]